MIAINLSMLVHLVAMQLTRLQFSLLHRVFHLQLKNKQYFSKNNESSLSSLYAS